MNIGITLKNANLHYSSLAYREASLKALFLKLVRGKLPKRLSDVHALKDITLNIASGERVALLGHNGAGKSTLLKLIAGLYPLSSGSRNIHGLVRSLFELTLGFEPEATGRENILYRGLLLGQTPQQIKALREEIIAFAELGEFIDYPIKTYSSGMIVRLAFGISTAIPGDILLLDEVIGVGDAAFMQKARARMGDLMRSAKILVLTTHDLGLAQELCTRGIVLQDGRLIFDGPIEQSIVYYQQHLKRVD